MAKYYNLTDAQFVLFLDNFIPIAQANLAVLGMTAAQITELTGLRNDLFAKLQAQTAAKEAQVAATRAVRDSRKGSNAKISFYNTRIKSDATIPNALKEQLGLDLDDKIPTTGVPQTPVELTGEGFSNGVNRLKWQRGANKPRVRFIIESRLGTAGAAWQMVGVTSKTAFEHKDQTPGEKIEYRVRAQIGEAVSVPSNSVTLYG